MLKFGGCNPYLIGGGTVFCFSINWGYSSQLPNSYFSEGWLNHQPDKWVKKGWLISWLISSEDGNPAMVDDTTEATIKT